MRKNLLAVFSGCLILILAACSSDPIPSNPIPSNPIPSNPTSSETLELQNLTWPVLREGNSGRDVVTVQFLLRHRGQTVTADGAFSPGTRSAVINFQSSRGLTADGIVGAATWTALIDTVQQGANNNAVRALQDQLRNRYGYNITVDGAFGPGTQSAVVAFQNARCLGADGIVGPITWSALVANTSSCGGSSGTSRASLAQSILNNSRITLWQFSPVGGSTSDGADARSNIRDTANGGAARRSAYGGAPGGSVFLDTRMLDGILRNANTYTFRITSIAGGAHSAGSRHYAGLAFDSDVINGVSVGARGRDSVVSGFMQACRNAGANEVLGPGDAGHSSHVHCAWPR